MDPNRRPSTARGVSPLRLSRSALFPILTVSLFCFGLDVAPAQEQVPPQSTSLPGVPVPARVDMVVNTSWLVDNLNAPNLVILQIGKDEAKYKDGHIPGAQFVPWNEIAIERAGLPNEMPPLEDLVKLVRRLGITQQSRVVLYDDETGVRAARAYVALDYLGLGDRASLLDGQWKLWTVEHRTVSKEIPTVIPSSFVPRPRPEIIVSLRDVRDISWEKTALKNSPVALVDARPPDQYNGTEPGEDIHRPGHIPGAVDVYSMDNYVAKDNPTFLPVGQLEAMYSNAGLDRKDLVVAYCRSGVQASLAYFTLKYLRYDVRLYDGSFIQWSSEKDTPVVGPGGSAETPAEQPTR